MQHSNAICGIYPRENDELYSAQVLLNHTSAYEAASLADEEGGLKILALALIFVQRFFDSPKLPMVQ